MSSFDESNQRVKKRRHLIYYLDVVDSDDSSIGRVVDITTGGLLVVSNTNYEDGIVKDVKVKLDNDIMGGFTTDLEVTLESRWSKQDVNPNYYITGFSFVNLTLDQTKLIDQIIGAIGFRD